MYFILEEEYTNSISAAPKPIKFQSQVLIIHAPLPAYLSLSRSLAASSSVALSFK